MRTTLAVLAAAVVLALAARADDPPTKGQIARTIKPAVALVHADTAYCSAACVSPQGYFLVPTHVLDRTGLARPVKVRMNVGLADEKAYPGRVVRIDPTLGLALVKVDAPDPLPALALGSDDKVWLTDELIGAAHPPPKPKPADRPWVFEPATAFTEKVTARKEQDGRPVRLDTSGPSVTVLTGGPVVDGLGRLVGVHPSDLTGQAGGLVTPVSVVRRFLAEPHVTFDLPAVKPAAMHDPLTVRVGVFSAADPEAEEVVQLLVRSGGRERAFDTKRAKDGRYEATFTPFDKTAPPVRVEIEYPDGVVRGETDERTLSVGGKPHLLSRVSGVRFGPTPAVQFPDGTSAEGEVKGVDRLIVTVGGNPLTVDLATARRLTVLPPTEPPGGFRLTAVVRQGGKEVGRGSELRFVEGSEPWGIDGLRLGLLTKPPLSDTAGTSAALVGAEGEHHFGGRTHRFDAKRVRVSGPPADLDSAFTVELHTTHPKEQSPLAVSVFQPGLSLRVQPPKGELLAARAYPNAVPPELLGFVDASVGVLLSVDGKDRPVTFAKLAVWELEVADGGKKVAKLAFDAILYPDGQTDTPVFLSVRLNSKYK